jgi:hypothetical protein
VGPGAATEVFIVTIEAARAVTRVLVIATPVVWIAWDVLAEAAFGPAATESVFIRDVGRRHGWFAPALGLAGLALYWHFFAGWGS